MIGGTLHIKPKSEGGSSNANVQAVDTSEELDDIETNTYVKYVAQTLTEEQKAQVRENIGVEENIDLSGYATKDDLNNKQDTLVSGSNIKTINGNSLLGSGDITIGGSGGLVNWNDIQYAPSYSSGSDLLDVNLVKCMQLLNSTSEKLEFKATNTPSTNYPLLSILTNDGDRVFNIWNTGDGTKFLSDDGTYKTLYTTTEIDSKLGDINTILESIINGG